MLEGCLMSSSTDACKTDTPGTRNSLSTWNRYSAIKYLFINFNVVVHKIVLNLIVSMANGILLCLGI